MNEDPRGAWLRSYYDNNSTADELAQAIADGTATYVGPDPVVSSYPTVRATYSGGRSFAKVAVPFAQVGLLGRWAKAPTYAHEGDAGADLYAAECAWIHPGLHQTISLGLAVAIPEGYVGLIFPRSGMAAKRGVTVLNTPGTIDSGYRGEVKVNLVNHGRELFAVNVGDRIAQLVIQQVERAHFELVEELLDTERGAGGHGSTGV